MDHPTVIAERRQDVEALIGQPLPGHFIEVLRSRTRTDDAMASEEVSRYVAQRASLLMADNRPLIAI